MICGKRAKAAGKDEFSWFKTADTGCHETTGKKGLRKKSCTKKTRKPLPRKVNRNNKKLSQRKNKKYWGKGKKRSIEWVFEVQANGKGGALSSEDFLRISLGAVGGRRVQGTKSVLTRRKES